MKKIYKNFFWLWLFSSLGWLVFIQFSHDSVYRLIWRNSRIAVVRIYPQEICRIRLSQLQSALLSYAKAHQGKLPPTPKADDYYFWMEPVLKYLPSENNSDYFFCCDDDLRKDPSSYIMDPKLGGKKLSELGDLSQVVLLREREFRHFGKAFYADAKDQVGRFAPGALPSGMRFDPQLPPRENTRVIRIFNLGELYNLIFFGLALLTLASLTGYLLSLKEKAKG